MDRPGRRTLQRVRSATGFLAETLLWVFVSLVVWVVLPALVLGWTPTVVTSGSMQPTIAPGDVVLLARDPDPDRLLQTGAIVTYGHPGEPSRWITHRVVEITEDGAYRTRGDANASTDPAPVPPQEVVGVARLVVPFVGMPLRWARDGAFLPIAGLLAAVVAAVRLVAHPATSPRRRPARRAPATPSTPVTSAVDMPTTAGPSVTPGSGTAPPSVGGPPGSDRVRLRPVVPRSRLGHATALRRTPTITAAALVGLTVVSAMPFTAARFDARATNAGNGFAAALAGEPDAPDEPLVLVLPAEPGSDVVSGGQTGSTVTVTAVLEQDRTLAGAAIASLQVRPNTPGNPPRDLEVSLSVDGQVLATTATQLRATGDDWLTLSLALAPELQTTLPAGSSVEVAVTVQRLDLAVGGPSFVTLPG